MLRAPSRRYLYCQSVGWGVFVATDFWIGHSLNYVVIAVFAGLLISHILRNAILKYGWLNRPLRQGLPWLLLATGLAAAAAGLTNMTIISLCGMRLPHLPWALRILFACMQYSLLFFPWTIMYCLHHHIQKTWQKNAEMRRLEWLLKEKSATAADTAVDLESVTRSLDRIRSLIGEDPAGARAEITAFSRLLREGYLKVDHPQ